MHICPGNLKLEKKITSLSKAVHASSSKQDLNPPTKSNPIISTPPIPTHTPASSKSKRAQVAPLPPSLNDLLKNFKASESTSLSQNTKPLTQLHTDREKEERQKEPTRDTKKHGDQPKKNIQHAEIVEEEEADEEQQDAEEEREEEKEEVVQMVEQPNGYFHDTKHSAYILKSDEEDKELSMDEDLYKQLFDYQRDGVKWMWGLYMKGEGGILGDDMGLGKTMQVVAFLSSMIRSGHISHGLVVAPVAVLEHWNSELEKWGKGIRVRLFHGTSKKERETNLERVIARLLTFLLPHFIY